MKILIVGGSTGREHFVIKNLKQNPNVIIDSYLCSHNPFIQALSRNYKVGDIRNFRNIYDFIQEAKPDIIYSGQAELINTDISDLIQKNINIALPFPKKVFLKT